jgi:hypothetical protein
MLPRLDNLGMRLSVFSEFYPHGELVAVRRAHREAVGNIVLQDYVHIDSNCARPPVKTVFQTSLVGMWISAPGKPSWLFRCDRWKFNRSPKPQAERPLFRPSSDRPGRPQGPDGSDAERRTRRCACVHRKRRLGRSHSRRHANSVANS